MDPESNSTYPASDSQAVQYVARKAMPWWGKLIVGIVITGAIIAVIYFVWQLLSDDDPVDDATDAADTAEDNLPVLGTTTYERMRGESIDTIETVSEWECSYLTQEDDFKTQYEGLTGAIKLTDNVLAAEILFASLLSSQAITYDMTTDTPENRRWCHRFTVNELKGTPLGSAMERNFGIDAKSATIFFFPWSGVMVVSTFDRDYVNEEDAYAIATNSRPHHLRERLLDERSEAIWTSLLSLVIPVAAAPSILSITNVYNNENSAAYRTESICMSRWIEPYISRGDFGPLILGGKLTQKAARTIVKHTFSLADAAHRHLLYIGYPNQNLTLLVNARPEADPDRVYVALFTGLMSEEDKSDKYYEIHQKMLLSSNQWVPRPA